MTKPHATPRKLGRRELLALGGVGLAASGLGVLAYRQWTQPRVGEAIEREGMLSPSAFVAMDGEGQVWVWVPRSEMGQGVRTGLAMIVAEELDTVFERVRVEQAPIDPRFGGMGTVGSTSVRTTWEPLRHAGATLRWMLLETAAARWGLDPAALETRPDVVVARDGSRRVGYGELVAAARERIVPRNAPLRDGPRRIVGTEARRVDIPDKVRGAAVYGLDVRPDGLRFAVLARAPAGAVIERVDVEAARAVRGVVSVLPLEELGAWAVVATSTWAALRGREALAASLSRSTYAGLDEAAILAQLREAATAEEHVLLSRGRVRDATDDETTVDLDLTFPYLAHAAMEPLSCTIDVDPAAGTAHLWAPTQHPVVHRDLAAEILGLPPEAVTLEVTYLGGGFGRRAEGDEIREAAHLARRIGAGLDGPIQLVWSREDDLRFDTFRGAAFARVRAVVAESGVPEVLSISVATPSEDPSAATDFMVHGLLDPIEAIPAQRVAWTGVRFPVRTGIWRSVAHSYTAFVMEHAIDVIAARAEVSVLEVRRRLLAERPRLLAVLERVLALAEPSPPAAGRARGVATHACFGSFVGQVAEVSVEGASVRVHRVWAAVDCGLVINPDLVRQQIEGGVIFGLSAALHGRVPIIDGAGGARSFADYPVLRLPEAPFIEVAIVDSTEAPSGVGELGVPCIAPAVANALLVLTGLPQAGLPLAVSPRDG